MAALTRIGSPGAKMRAVQMSLDETLQAWFAGHQERRLEAQHKLGYDRFPVEPGEFDFADPDHGWGD